MSLQRVIKTLHFERYRFLAMSRICDPIFAKEYLSKADDLRIAAQIVSKEVGRRKRKGK